jgi:dipeptidyl-peptidase-4
MKLYKLSLWMLVLGSSALAQTQKFTMAEAVNGMRTNLAVKNISQFSWSADGKSYIQAVKGGYLITDLKTNKQDTLVSLSQLNKNLTDNKFKAVPQIKFISNSQGYFNSGGKMVWVEKSGSDWKTKNLLLWIIMLKI